MKKIFWLNSHHIITFHAKQMHEHGGSRGIRDKALLESAITKPQHLFSYEKPSIYELAASYAHGIIKNHAFMDGNKRTAIVTAIAFLEMNSYLLEVDEAELVQQVIKLADGSLNQNEFALWLKDNTKYKK